MQAAAGIQRQTRSPPSTVVWWEVTRGPITGAIFVSLSKQLLCPCGIDLDWHCQVNSATPLSVGNPGAPNRGTSHVPGPIRVQVHPGPEHMWSGPLPSLHQQHTYDMTTVPRRNLTVWQYAFVYVCVFMQQEFMTLFLLVGWHKALTLGSFLSLLATKSLPPGIRPYSSRAILEFWQDFHSACALAIVVVTTQRSFIKRMIKMLNRESHDDLIFSAASLSREGG